MTENELQEANGLVARYRNQRFTSPLEALTARQRLVDIGLDLDAPPSRLPEDDGA